jgi:hypothetical protein
MGAGHQALLMAGSVSNPDLIRLLFNGANGGSTFTDDGSAGTVWTRSGVNVTTSTTGAQEGSACLHVGGATDYLEADYTSANDLGSGNFFIGFWWTPVTVATSRYVCAVQPVATAAGRAFVWATNVSNQITFFMSDGTTLYFNGANLGGITAGTPTYLSIQRTGGTVYVRRDGTSAISNSSAAAGNPVNIPTSGKLRFGSPQTGQNSFASHRFDLVQLRRSDPFGGADFTPPTSLIP